MNGLLLLQKTVAATLSFKFTVFLQKSSSSKDIIFTISDTSLVSGMCILKDVSQHLLQSSNKTYGL